MAAAAVLVWILRPDPERALERELHQPEPTAATALQPPTDPADDVSGELADGQADSSAVDGVRLAEVRAEIEAALRLPADHDDRRATWARLRRQGWPLGTHLRALALGPDEALARQALLEIPDDGSTLAGALLRPGLQSDVLALVEQRPDVLTRSRTLARAIEGLALDDDRCLRLLAGSDQAALEQALRRTLAARLRVLDDLPDIEAQTALLATSRCLPAGAALELLLDAVPILGAASTAGFQALLSERGESARDAVVSYLASTLPLPPQPWIEATGDDRVVPLLLRRLDRGDEAPAILSCLASLGGPSIAGALALRFDVESSASDDPLLVALGEVLQSEDSRSAAALGLAARGSDALLALAHALPATRGAALIVSALAAGQRSADADGHRAALLLGLGQLGSRDQAPALLSQLVEGAGEADLAALTWVVAAKLDPAAAGQAWEATGRSADVLLRAAKQCDRRLARALPPSRTDLIPLERALRRQSASLAEADAAVRSAGRSPDVPKRLNP